MRGAKFQEDLEEGPQPQQERAAKIKALRGMHAQYVLEWSAQTTCMCAAALFISQVAGAARCPPTDEWTQETRCIHTTECYLATKRNEEPMIQSK